MIILSRHRDSEGNKTTSNTRFAEALAERFETHVLSIPFLYDLRSFGRSIQRLREIRENCCFLAPFPTRATNNLLISLGIYHDKITDRYPLLAAAMDLPPLNGDVDMILHEVEKALEDTEIPVGNVPGGLVERIDEPTVKRWYPVISLTDCIGCLECVNFCLFGVYTIGEGDLPIVDQPDACRDGCPACSRVCPSAAIMFPMHDDPIIAGRKIRLPGMDQQQAESERDRHLSGKINKEDKDELDDLVDTVDQFSF